MEPPYVGCYSFEFGIEEARMVLWCCVRDKNVAADLGFNNPFHFSRVFKSVFAVALETFRKLR